MPKLLIVHTLTEKRAEILGQIKAYEAQIAQRPPEGLVITHPNIRGAEYFH